MRYGIALGSNLGDRQAHLKRGLDLMMERLADAGTTVISRIFETAPMDCPAGSPNFYNTFVEIESSDEPLQVLRTLRAIEAEMGRPNAHEHHAPRTLDLDIIYADDRVMNHPDLTLPHPGATERRFVLQPMALVRPDLILPLQTKSVAELLAALPDDGSQMSLISDHWAA